VILKTAGTQSVTATDTLTSSITGTRAASSSLRPQPRPRGLRLTTPGLPDDRQHPVTAVDAYGNRVHGYLGTIHFTSSDAKAKLPANYTFTPLTPVPTCSPGRDPQDRGTQSVTATDTVTKTIKGAQTGIVVKAAAVKTLTSQA